MRSHVLFASFDLRWAYKSEVLSDFKYLLILIQYHYTLRRPESSYANTSVPTVVLPGRSIIIARTAHLPHFVEEIAHVFNTGLEQ